MRTRPAVVAVLAALAALAGCSSGPATPLGTDVADPAATAPVAVTTTAGAATTGTAAPAGAPAASAGASGGVPTFTARGLVPLWPFTTAAQVRTWQDAYRGGGHQPWHLDPGRTALTFTRAHLGYGEIDRVTTLAVSGGDARVGVGWTDPETDLYAVAVLHLVRYGTGGDAPWVVVGSDDTDLTLDTPRYGGTVGSPLRVGGVISGVDESLRVIVLGPTSPTPLGVVQGIPAGGTRTPWSATVRFAAAPGTVLTVAVSTGGHVKGVERFAITAVRAA